MTSLPRNRLYQVQPDAQLRRKSNDIIPEGEAPPGVHFAGFVLALKGGTDRSKVHLKGSEDAKADRHCRAADAS